VTTSRHWSARLPGGVLAVMRDVDDDTVCLRMVSEGQTFSICMTADGAFKLAAVLAGAAREIKYRDPVGVDT